MENNVTKTDYGYALEWAKHDNYGGKILVFERAAKTDFAYSLKTEKSWFVNDGAFMVRWVDTTDGKTYQQELQPGVVFHCKTNVPYSLSCVSERGSVAECNNGYHEGDEYIVIKKEVL